MSSGSLTLVMQLKISSHWDIQLVRLREGNERHLPKFPFLYRGSKCITALQKNKQLSEPAVESRTMELGGNQKKSTCLKVLSGVNGVMRLGNIQGQCETAQ